MITKKPNNEYISAAVDILDGINDIVKTKQDRNKVIESKYNSYISSFGGSIIQSGLLATLMIFEANSEKNKIIELLFRLINSARTQNRLGTIAKTGDKYYKTVKSINGNMQNSLRNELVEMAVALKLAMRCFKQVDNFND